MFRKKSFTLLWPWSSIQCYVNISPGGDFKRIFFFFRQREFHRHNPKLSFAAMGQLGAPVKLYLKHQKNCEMLSGATR